MNKNWKTYSSDIPSNASRVCSRYKVGADGRLQTVAGIGTEVVKVFNPTEGVRFIDAATANPLIDSKGILFSPKAISGLQLWLDASDASTVFDSNSGGTTPADGGQIGRWEDKSGNDNHALQAYANLRPFYQISEINGKNAVLFDGSNDVFSLTTNILLNPDATTFAVFTRATTGIHNNFLSNALRINFFTPFFYNNNLIYHYKYVDIGGNYTNSVANTSTGLMLLEGSEDSTRSPYRSITKLNGVEVVNGNAEIGANAYLNVVGRYYNSHSNNGNICEIVHYDKALNSTELSQVRTYLATKWGISLP